MTLTDVERMILDPGGPTLLPIYVLAGNHGQFRNYCHDKCVDHHRLHYLFPQDQGLRGMHTPVVLRIGTWRDRVDAWEIERQMHWTQARVVDDPSW